MLADLQRTDQIWKNYMTNGADKRSAVVGRGGVPVQMSKKLMAAKVQAGVERWRLNAPLRGSGWQAKPLATDST